MSDDENKKPEIRRVTQRDRKRSLKAAQPLFPDERDADANRTDDSDAEATSEPPDTSKPSAKSMPDETVDLDPSAMDDVEVPSIHVAAVIAKDHNPQNITPPEERFPPLSVPAEDDEDTHHPEATPDSKKRKRRVGDWRHNLIAVIFLIATIGMCGVYTSIWNDRYSAINPFPPATPFRQITETPNATVEAAFFATETAVARPTNTPTATITPNIPTVTPSLASSAPPFAADGAVLYTPNSNGDGCDWASIAGTVTDINGRALNNFGIQVIDVENPDQLNLRVFSGAALTFGEGGFEIPLGNAPREAQYSIQLFSPAGVPVSDPVFVVTSADCEQNVAIINFVQTRPV